MTASAAWLMTPKRANRCGNCSTELKPKLRQSSPARLTVRLASSSGLRHRPGWEPGDEHRGAVSDPWQVKRVPCEEGTGDGKSRYTCQVDGRIAQIGKPTDVSDRYGPLTDRSEQPEAPQTLIRACRSIGPR